MKLYSIKNEKFQVTIKKEGAELSSFKSLKKGIEYIWKGDSDIWGEQAPNLFPIVGNLKGGTFIFEGKEYACPQHGIIRYNKNISLINKTENSLTFGLKFSEESLKDYPFKFEFQIKFLLEDNKLTIKHTISNHGDEIMFFSLGGHPGFTCPIHKNETYTDYYLEFENPETAKSWQILDKGMIGKETFPAFDEPTKINLHPQIFDNDALVFKNLNSSKVSLKSKKSNQIITVEFKDFSILGIWAKPNAPYVCIEPWLGIGDSLDSNKDFKTKEGILKLEAKKDFIASYNILIQE